jgi:uncharacterized protein YkwD
MKKILLLFLLIIPSIIGYSQDLTKEEAKLYEIIMKYRKKKGLPEIPISASLTIVAQTHVKDLAENKPDMGDCNAHSWSDKGTWSPCCYLPDHSSSECMWYKPSELTSYKSNGYEIACGSNDCCSSFIVTAKYALEAWQKSPNHNAVIVNKGIWKNHEWKAIGIGIYKGFAVVWFGEEPDI